MGDVYKVDFAKEKAKRARQRRLEDLSGRSGKIAETIGIFLILGLLIGIMLAAIASLTSDQHVKIYPGNSVHDIGR